MDVWWAFQLQLPVIHRARVKLVIRPFALFTWIQYVFRTKEKSPIHSWLWRCVVTYKLALTLFCLCFSPPICMLTSFSFNPVCILQDYLLWRQQNFINSTSVEFQFVTLPSICTDSPVIPSKIFSLQSHSQHFLRELCRMCLCLHI